MRHSRANLTEMAENKLLTSENSLEKLKFYNSGDVLFHSPAGMTFWNHKGFKINFYLQEDHILCNYDGMDFQFEIWSGSDAFNSFIKHFIIIKNDEIKIVFKDSIPKVVKNTWAKIGVDYDKIKNAEETLEFYKKMFNSRKFFISKKYLPFKNQIIEFLNDNYSNQLDDDYLPSKNK
ncbi:hypothetical protein [Flavobacterium chungnamense]